MEECSSYFSFWADWKTDDENRGQWWIISTTYTGKWFASLFSYFLKFWTHVNTVLYRLTHFVVMRSWFCYLFLWECDLISYWTLCMGLITQSSRVVQIPSEFSRAILLSLFLWTLGVFGNTGLHTSQLFLRRQWALDTTEAHSINFWD